MDALIRDGSISRSSNTTYLLGSRDTINHLLQGTSAVLVESNDRQIRSRVLDENRALLVIGIL